MNTPRTSWHVADLGMIPYRTAHRLQLGLVAARHAGRFSSDLVLLLEHPAVFTLGRRGGRDHLRVSETFLREKAADVIPVERGGDITWHGPGQLVGYPIVHLRNNGIDARRLVRSLEDVMLRTAADCGVAAGRDPKNAGVWVNGRKLGSIGLAVRQGISFHGFSLNIANSLEPFEWIDPCGLEGVSMTALCREMPSPVDPQSVRNRLTVHLADVFGVTLAPINPEILFHLAGVER